MQESFSFDTTSYKAVIVSQRNSISIDFPNISLAFTIAQSPHEMRELMVGLWFTAEGFGYIITINKYLFYVKQRQYAKVFFFIAKSVIILIIFIVFLVLASCYMVHVSDNEVKMHLIYSWRTLWEWIKKKSIIMRWDSHLSALTYVYILLYLLYI